MSSLSAKPAAADVPVAGHALFKLLSHVCFVAGFLSIIASIAVWILYRPTEVGHGERFAIFVGLWPPTFFALSDRLDRYVTPRNH